MYLVYSAKRASWHTFCMPVGTRFVYIIVVYDLADLFLANTQLANHSTLILLV
jgi:hypothetical protein